MQELSMWENLDSVISVSNDGFICCAVSNGKSQISIYSQNIKKVAMV